MFIQENQNIQKKRGFYWKSNRTSKRTYKEHYPSDQYDVEIKEYENEGFSEGKTEFLPFIYVEILLNCVCYKENIEKI